MSFMVNISDVGRGFRAVVGLFLLALIFVGPKTLWGLIGLVPLLTAVLGYCPVYSLPGLACACCKKDAPAA